MELSLPLKLAQQMVTNAFSKPTPTTVEDGMLMFSFFDTAGNNYEGVIEHDLPHEVLTVGVMTETTFLPWEGYDTFFRFLAGAVSMYLNGRCGERGFFQVYPVDGSAGYAYETPVSYGFLDDQECFDALRVAFERCLRALALTDPVFARVQETGIIPNGDEILHLMDIRHGEMELEGFLGTTSPRVVQLPPRLYGGVGILRPQ